MGAFRYRSKLNRYRAARGRSLVVSHPDFPPEGVDFETAASDSVADILHALTVEHEGLGERDARAFLDRALRGRQGDFEDEEVRS